MKRAARLNAILDLLADGGEVRSTSSSTASGHRRRPPDAISTRSPSSDCSPARTAARSRSPSPTSCRSATRATSAREQKESIAQAAAALVAPGMVVGLSGGTTTTAIAAALAARDDLAAGAGITVVTNAVNIAAQLATRPDIKVVVTGGVIHSRSYELVGPFVEQLLRGVRLDIAFIGVNGMDAARRRHAPTTNARPP